jgi:hypothetical protein
MASGPLGEYEMPDGRTTWHLGCRSKILQLLSTPHFFGIEIEPLDSYNLDDPAFIAPVIEDSLTTH